MNWSAGKIGTIYQKPAQAIGLSTLPIGCVLDLPGLPGAGNKIYDRSPYGNHGTIVGATWKRTSGGLWYLDFDGTDDYIDTVQTFQSTLRGSFSIVMWIKPDDGQPAAKMTVIGTQNSPANQDIIEVDVQPSGKIAFYYESNNIVANLAETNAAVYADGVGAWKQLFLVADSTVGGVGGLVIYVDGSLQILDATNDGDTTGVDFALFTTSDEVFIGCEDVGGTPDNDFNGGIALVRIYNRVLSALEIQNHFNREKHLFGVW